MSKLIAILNEFGAEIFPKNTFRLPFKLKSSNFPVGIKYVAGSSAQLKSAAILAALNSYGTTTIFSIEGISSIIDLIFLRVSIFLLL